MATLKVWLAGERTAVALEVLKLVSNYLLNKAV